MPPQEDGLRDFTIEGVGPVQTVGMGPSRKGERAGDPLQRLKGLDPEDSSRIVRATEELFSILQKAREPFAQMWAEHYDWARGLHWDERRPQWKSHFKANYIFSNIFNKAALVTDSRPEVKALPRRPDQSKLVTGSINPWLSYAWDIMDLDQGFMETMAGALIFGTYFWKPYWDPTLWEGLGDVQTALVEPIYLFPDPGAVNIPDSEVMCHAEPMSLAAIARLFPEYGDKVEPEDVASSGIWNLIGPRRQGPQMPPDRKPWYKGLPVISGFLSRQQQQTPDANDIPRAILKEFWIKDDTVVEDEKGKRFRYPQGRKIHVANGVLLNPDPEEQESPHQNGRFPFIRFRDYLWPREFWGGGEVEQTLELQREMNLQRARISEHFHHFSNGKWIVDAEARVNTDTLSNNPAQVIVKRKGGEVRRESGLALPSSMIDFLAFCQRDMENIGGNTDVNQGRVPDRISSGLAIQEVKEAAQARVRLTERLAKESIEDWAEMAMAIAGDNYESKRMVRVTGPDGQPSFVSIGSKQLQMRLDFEAAVGSQILRGRQKLSVNDAVALSNIGYLDQQAVLEAIDFPEFKSVMARMRTTKDQIIRMIETDPAFGQAILQTIQGQQQPQATGPNGLVMGGR